MFVNVWEFYVKRELERQFEIVNGPAGKWNEFFSKSPEFLGTHYLKAMQTIMKSDEITRRYLTQDKWKSQESAELYVMENQERFGELAELNNGLVLFKNHIGFFAANC